MNKTNLHIFVNNMQILVDKGYTTDDAWKEANQAIESEEGTKSFFSSTDEYLKAWKHYEALSAFHQLKFAQGK